MTDIVAFLTARLDQREAFAKACLVGADSTESRLGKWSAYLEGGDDGWAFEACDRTGFGGIVEHEPVARHIEINDPAYVLRDVAAKRRRLALYVEQREIVDKIGDNPDDCTWSQAQAAIGVLTGLEASVRLDAAPHAGHPDYDPAWAVA